MVGTPASDDPMRSFLLAALLAALPALAQEVTPPPSPPLLYGLPAGAVPPDSPPPQNAPPPQPPQQELREQTYFDRCFAYPAQVWVEPHASIYVSGSSSGATPAGSRSAHGAAPVGQRGGSGGSGGSGTSGGGDVGEAALVLVVAVAMLLPVVVYALDVDAAPVVLQRFHCPAMTFEGAGGTQTGASVAGTLGVATGRVTFAVSHVGGDFQFEAGPGAISVFAAHLLLRPEPKEHVEGGLALGYRSAVHDGVFREGFELGLPHRYAFFRSGLRTLGLDVRPYLVWGRSGLDAGLEGAFVFPLAEFLHLRLGGRVFSWGSDVLYGFDAGLGLVL